jgi:ceramide synthetase
MPVEDVAFYARMFRRHKSNEAKISKFIEALWRFIFYSIFVVVGFLALFYPEPQPWLPFDGTFWGLYKGWPHHPMTGLLRFYYLVELGGYLHQLMWTEVSRSDSLEMISHHIITITLVSVSYRQNFTRVGSLFLILHDISDVFLEFAKCVHYTSMVKGREFLQIYCDVLFGIFAVSFFVLRIVILPYLTIVSFWNEGWTTLGANWWGAWIFAGCSYGLQFLHCFWFYLIMKMVVRMMIVGNVEQDIRSDDEAESDDETSKPGSAIASAAAVAEGLVGVEAVHPGTARHVVHAASAEGVEASAEEMKVGRKKTKKVD